MSLFNSKNFFHLLVSTLFCLLPANYMLIRYTVHVHVQHQHLYLSVLKNTSKEGLELLRLLINSGALLRKKIMHVAKSAV